MCTEEIEVIARTICELKGVDLPNLKKASECFIAGFELANSIQREQESKRKGTDRNNFATI